jgi:hypothetical protein
MTVNCKIPRPFVEEIAGCASSCPTPAVHSERKRKQVAFVGYVRVRGILHIDDYTDEEFFSTWYDPEDMKLITQDIRQTLAKMESGELVEDDEHFCRRGVESRTKHGASIKKQIRLAARNAVLDEQEEGHACQQGSMMYNEQLISESYMDVTLVSKLAAARRGFEDHQEVIDQISHFISKNVVCCSSIFPIESPQLRKRTASRLLNEGLRQLYNHAA